MEACKFCYPSANLVFSLYHIKKRIKKLFSPKATYSYEKALSFISTDYFLRDFLDLMSPENPFNLNYDQLNYLNFLYQTKTHWQALFIPPHIMHIGLNTPNWFLKFDAYSKLSKSLTKAKHFKLVLDTSFQNHQLAFHRFYNKTWYRTHYIGNWYT